MSADSDIAQAAAASSAASSRSASTALKQAAAVAAGVQSSVTAAQAAAAEATEQADRAQAAHPYVAYDANTGWPARPATDRPIGWVDPTGEGPKPPNAQPGDLYFPRF